MQTAKQSYPGPACASCGAPAHRAASTITKLIGATEVIHLVFEWACSRCGRAVEGAVSDRDVRNDSSER